MARAETLLPCNPEDVCFCLKPPLCSPPAPPLSPPWRSPFPPFSPFPVSELPRAVLTLCYRSSVPAALALCCMAMLEVSAMGCASLAIGMAALLLPRRCESVWTHGGKVSALGCIAWP